MLRDRKSTREREDERDVRGELTLQQKRLGVPALNELRKLPSQTDLEGRNWVQLSDGRIVAYRNLPSIRAPEEYDDIPNYGVISVVFQITKTTWLVFFN
jgi:hypothetical protein